MRVQPLLLAAIVVIGVVAARGAHGFFPALNDPAPALAQAPRWQGAPSPPLARKVVFVIIDGLRLDASRTMASLEALRAKGTGVVARAGFPTISKANYLTLMAGVPPRWSGARTNDGFRLHAIDSLFARAKAASYVADRTRGIARLFGVDGAETASWANGLAGLFARAYARSDLTVLFFIAVDAAGHAHGGDSDGYARSVRDVDGYLAQMLAGVDLTRDAIVITADHGHTDFGGHGGYGTDVELVPLVMAGAGVRPGGATIDAHLVDVAPTIAALLGIAAPGHGTGRTLVELLAVDGAHRDAMIAADASRLAHVRAITDRLERDEGAAHHASMMLRVPLAVVALGGLVVLIVLLVRRRRIRLDAIVIVAATMFVVAFYVGLYLVDGGRRFPGVPSSASALWAKTAVYAAIALVLFVIAAVLAARRSPARAWGTVLLAIACAALPALAAWSLVGLPLATMLPSPLLVSISPVAYVALTHTCLASLIVLAIVRLRR